MEIYQLAIFILAILGYGIVLAKYVPERSHFVLNVLAAISAIVYGWSVGLSFEQVGLSVHFIVGGIWVAIAASLVMILGIFFVSRIGFLHQFFTLPKIMQPGKVAYETAIRIPLSTALTEEILFRGILFAIAAQLYGAIVGALISSVVFGIWHILPSFNSLAHRKIPRMKFLKIPPTILYILFIVLVTTLAGTLFCWLRVISGSIIAPWLLHWTVNSSGLLAAVAVKMRKAA